VAAPWSRMEGICQESKEGCHGCLWGVVVGVTALQAICSGPVGGDQVGKLGRAMVR
jgi:hypothetical protein